MSAVYEVSPTHCPDGHAWDRPGTFLVGWSASPITGGMGHRTWTCQTCGAVTHAEQVELRPVTPPRE